MRSHLNNAGFDFFFMQIDYDGNPLSYNDIVNAFCKKNTEIYYKVLFIWTFFFAASFMAKMAPDTMECAPIITPRRRECSEKVTTPFAHSND